MSAEVDSQVITRRVGKPIVISLHDEASGAVYPLDPRRTGYVIGHGLHADIRLADLYVSSFHCALIRCGRGDVLVVNRNSRNGVHIDGVRIEKAYLTPGARLHIGKTTLVAVGDGERPALPAAPLRAMAPWDRALALLGQAIGQLGGRHVGGRRRGRGSDR